MIKSQLSKKRTHDLDHWIESGSEIRFSTNQKNLPEDWKPGRFYQPNNTIYPGIIANKRTSTSVHCHIIELTIIEKSRLILKNGNRFRW